MSRNRIRFTGRRRAGAGVIALALVQVLAFGSTSWAAPAAGDPDASFGTDGRVTTDASNGGEDRANALVVQPDGKTVVAGSSGFDFLVMRYDVDGTLDEEFGDNGIVTTDFHNGRDVATAVALDKDMRIVVAGYARVDGADQFAVARYLPDNGALDHSTVTTIEEPGPDQRFSRARAVAVQSDGKVVVAGGACRYTMSEASLKRFALVRYRDDLTPDPAFNGGDLDDDDGIITTLASSSGTCNVVADDVAHDGNSLKAVALSDDGAIVATGSKGNHFAVARYTTEGGPDVDFDGGTGTGAQVQVTEMGSQSTATGVALLPGNGILASGYANLGDGLDFVAVRYNAHGEVDLNFGGAGTGTATVDLGGDDLGSSLALRPDGSAVIAGRSSGDFALAQLDPDGILDPAFDDDGIVTTEIRHESWAHGVAVAGCRIVAGGFAKNSGPSQRADVAVARYLGGGTPVVESVAPVQGPHTGGTEVTVKGKCLDAGTTVAFGGIPATVSQAGGDGKSLVVTTPAHDPGSVPVTATSVTGEASLAADAPMFIFTADSEGEPEQDHGDDGGEGAGTNNKDSSGSDSQAAPPDGTRTAPSPDATPSPAPQPTPEPQVAPSDVTGASPSPSPSVSPGLQVAPSPTPDASASSSLNAAPSSPPTPPGATSPAPYAASTSSQAAAAAPSAVPAPPPATASGAAPAPAPMPPPPPSPGLPVVSQIPAPTSSPAPLPSGMREDLPGASAAPAGGTGSPVSPGGGALGGTDSAGRFDMVAHEADPAMVFAFGTAGIMALSGLVVVCFGADSAAARRGTRPRPQAQPA